MSVRMCRRCAPSAAISTAPDGWSNYPTACIPVTASFIRWSASGMTDQMRFSAKWVPVHGEKTHHQKMSDRNAEHFDHGRRTALALLASSAAGLAAGSTDAKADTQQTPRDAALCPEVLGKFLRVQRPGEAITMDFRADRLTIEVDEKSRIKSIRVG